MGLKEWIIPQDKAFFDILEKESENVAVGAQKLEEAIGEFDRMDERRRELKDIEHVGDDIVHQIYDKVNGSFITPIDQQDIIKLATLYDDVLDFIYAVMNRIVLYEVRESTPTMLMLAQLVSRSVDVMHAGLISVRSRDGYDRDDP